MKTRALYIPFIGLALFMGLSMPLFAANTYEVGDKLYVWARSGLNLRGAAGTQGKKLTKLPAGTEVEVQSITSKTYRITALTKLYLEDDVLDREYNMEEPYRLTGTWIKVRAGKWEGYVIDTYLLHYQAPVGEEVGFGSLMQLVDSLPLTRTKYSDNGESEDGEEHFAYHYTNSLGMSYMSGETSVGVDEEWIVPGLDLEEGFVLVNYFWGLEDANRRKKGQELLAVQDASAEHLYLTAELGFCEYSFYLNEEGHFVFYQGCSC